MQERRTELGGYMPSREVPQLNFKAPELDYFAEWTAGSKGRAVSTTMGFVSILRHLHEGSGDRQADCADRSRRRPHLWPGIGDPPGRHLRARRTEVQAARRGHAALLPRGEGRPDSRRRHHRSRLDGLLHRGGHGVLELSRARRFPSTCTTRCSASSASAT